MHVGMGTGFAHQRGDGYQDAQLMREEFENCVLAEELGFDSVWITEHHFSDYSICTDPVQALTYLAGRTRRIRLGTQVIVVPWHHPVRLAERIVMLDHVSNGRAILGFGRGLARHEFEGLGVDQSRSRELYDDILKIVIPALETGIIDASGTSFDLPRRELRPRPAAQLRGAQVLRLAQRRIAEDCGGDGLRPHHPDAAAARLRRRARSLSRRLAAGARAGQCADQAGHLRPICGRREPRPRAGDWREAHRPYDAIGDQELRARSPRSAATKATPKGSCRRKRSTITSRNSARP